MTILVTGCAGFIGFHVSQRLLRDGHAVHGLDNLNGYYDPALKEARLGRLLPDSRFTFHRADLADPEATARTFAAAAPVYVVHLAAQAGVRYSAKNPRACVTSNLDGFLNVLEGCRLHRVPHLVYASSSSVYGLNTTLPFSVHHNVDHPVSLYAATKKANELMAHSYSHMFGLPTTGLRFFTVYGPWGRPDMAYYTFTQAILEGRKIDVYNHGQMRRDFTYIDDVVETLSRLIFKPAAPNPAWSGEHPDTATSLAPYRLYNIGTHSPVPLLHLIEIIEAHLGKKAVKQMLPLQPGEVLETGADVEDLIRDVGFAPTVPIEQGIKQFLDWYHAYHAR